MTNRRLGSVAVTAALLFGGCGNGDEEAKTFKASLPHSRVAVYPTVVRSPEGVTHDAAAASALAGVLGGAGAKGVILADQKLRLSDKRSFNQAAMFKSSMEAFGTLVRANPPQAEYAAVVEFLTSSNGAVGGIHLYVVRRDGSRAFGCLLNSHYPEFKKIMPRSTNEATGVLLTWFRDHFPAG